MTEEASTASVSPAPAAALGGSTGPGLVLAPVPRQPRRIKLTDEQLEAISREDLIKNWRELDTYVELVESQTPSAEAILHLRECEERIKQQYLESTHREKVLVRRLATKEQEMQEYVSQIAELKSEKAPGPAALRSALLDPAVNLLLQRLRQELVSTKARLDETQNELSAWKFTPDSNTGKRLMAKCRLLHQENEELGRTISSGRLAKLEGDLALQKSFSDEVKKSQSELDEFLQDLDEDVEGMQSTIYYLQQELRKAKDELAAVQQENQLLKNGSAEDATNEINGSSMANLEIKTEAESPCKAEASPIPEPDPQPLAESQDSQEEEEEEVEEAPKPIVTNPIEQDESANQHPPSPAVVPPTEPKRQWRDDSSDSGELILNIEAEAIEDNEEADVRGSPKRKRSFDEVPDEAQDEVPAAKKVRRDSELSLHYSEDEEMLLKESVEEEVARKSPQTKVSDDDDGSDDTPLSLVRRDSQ